MAGFLEDDEDDEEEAPFPAADAAYVLGLEPAALELVMLMALAGRAKGMGLAEPGLEGEAMAAKGEEDRPGGELGCWRMAKTKVLLRARRWHWGWTT